MKANAKINLTLDVLRKREDGYHDLCMVMQSITLSDMLTFRPKQPKDELRVYSNLDFLPTGRKNLAAIAALNFWQAAGMPEQGLEIHIEKRIPVCAGMAGGSSDAAAVLRWLNEQNGNPFTMRELAKIGERVGSDVPYCVLGCTALAEGRGEILTELPKLPHCWVVVSKPEFPISTPELFAKIDSTKLRCRPDTTGVLEALKAQDLDGVAKRMYNVFEDALPKMYYSRISELKRLLIHYGAMGANMTGSGSATFGLFSDEATAQTAYEELKQICEETFLCESV